VKLHNAETGIKIVDDYINLAGSLKAYRDFGAKKNEFLLPYRGFLFT
jgi:hypothetical protein